MYKFARKGKFKKVIIWFGSHRGQRAIRENKYTHLLFDYYHSVVDEVEDDLEDAAEAGGQGDPQVDLISSGVGDVFLRFCPEESVQEVVSGVDLVH